MGYITHPSPSCSDECWTYMYKVDPAAAAVPQLHVLIRRNGNQMAVMRGDQTHAYLLSPTRSGYKSACLWSPCITAICHSVAECRSRKNREPRLQPRYHVTPNSCYTAAHYNEFPVPLWLLGGNWHHSPPVLLIQLLNRVCTAWHMVEHYNV